MYYHNVGLKDGFAQEEEVQRCLRKWFVFEKKNWFIGVSLFEGIKKQNIFKVFYDLCI